MARLSPPAGADLRSVPLNPPRLVKCLRIIQARGPPSPRVYLPRPLTELFPSPGTIPLQPLMWDMLFSPFSSRDSRCPSFSVGQSKFKDPQFFFASHFFWSPRAGPAVITDPPQHGRFFLGHTPVSNTFRLTPEGGLFSFPPRLSYAWIPFCPARPLTTQRTAPCYGQNTMPFLTVIFSSLVSFGDARHTISPTTPLFSDFFSEVYHPPFSFCISLSNPRFQR